MGHQAKKYQTQWAAQFYVAAELTRRGYLVSLTMGNAPVADLLVVSPKQTTFQIDVKGQSTRNFWLIQRREPTECGGLFFVLVYLPKDSEPPRFYVLSGAELMKRRDEYEQRVKTAGSEYQDNLGGINWSTAFEYENRWKDLPS